MCCKDLIGSLHRLKKLNRVALGWTRDLDAKFSPRESTVAYWDSFFQQLCEKIPPCLAARTFFVNPAENYETCLLRQVASTPDTDIASLRFFHKILLEHDVPHAWETEVRALLTSFPLLSLIPHPCCFRTVCGSGTRVVVSLTGSIT